MDDRDDEVDVTQSERNAMDWVAKAVDVPPRIQKLIDAGGTVKLSGTFTWESHQKWFKKSADSIKHKHKVRWRSSDKCEGVSNNDRNKM